MSGEPWKRCGALLAGNNACLSANEDYYRLSGYAEKEFLERFGADLRSAIHPRDREQVSEAIRRQLLSGEEYVEAQYRVLRKDGRVAWHMVYGGVCKLPDGTDGLRCTVFDITPQVARGRQLEEANRRLDTIIANLPGGVVRYTLKNPAKSADFISKGMLEMLGCTRAQFFEEYGGDVGRFLHPEDFERIRGEMALVDGPRPVQPCGYRIITTDGATKWLSGNRQIVRGPDNSLSAYFIVVDVTGMQEINERLKRSHRMLDGLLDNIPGGVARIAFDEKLSVLFANRSFYAMTGYTQEEWGQPPINGNSLYLVHPEDLPGLLRIARQSLETGETLETRYRIRRKDGGIVWVWANGSVMEMRDGVPIIQAVFIDNTVEYEAQKALERYSRQQTVMFNAIPGGVAQLTEGPDGPRWSVNDGYLRMVGFSREAFERLTPDEFEGLIDPRDRERILGVMKSSVQARRSIREEYRCHRASGEPFWVLLLADYSGEQDGKTVYQCIFVDITEQKRVQRELEYEKERYRIILECSSDVVYEYNLDTDTMSFYDRSIGDQYGFQDGKRVVEGYLKRLSGLNLVHPDYIDAVAGLCRGELEGAQEILIRKPGAQGDAFFWFEMRGSLVHGGADRARTLIGVLRDIDRQKRENELLRVKSMRDSLTGLRNKSAIRAGISDYLLHEGRDVPSALLLIDLDDFKSANDLYGHQFGDAVLAEVGRTLTSLFRDSDYVGRVGGDEFVVFMKEVMDFKVVREKAASLCRLLDARIIDGRRFRLSGSVGIACYPRDGADYDALFCAADAAMYNAKGGGKGRYRVAGELTGQPPSPPSNRARALETEKSQRLREILAMADACPQESLAVPRVLETMGNACGVSCAYVALSDGRGGARLAYHWRAGENAPEDGALPKPGREDREGLRLFFDQDDRVFHCADLEQAGSAYLERIHRRYGVRAMLQCRLGKYGFVGLAEHRRKRMWTQEETDFLTAVTHLLHLLYWRVL